MSFVGGSSVRCLFASRENNSDRAPSQPTRASGTLERNTASKSASNCWPDNGDGKHAEGDDPFADAEGHEQEKRDEEEGQQEAKRDGREEEGNDGRISGTAAEEDAEEEEEEEEQFVGIEGSRG